MGALLFLRCGRSPPRAFALLLAASLAPGAAAQDVVPIDGTPLCAECRVVLDSVVVLDGRRGDYVGEPLALARMSDGRWLLSPMHDASGISVFDRRGRFVRTVGRRGAGPGEFQFVRHIKVGAGDTVRVFDIGHRRASILAPDLTFRRSTPIEIRGPIDLEVLPDGRIVAVEDMRVRGRGGFELHVLAADGKISGSFDLERADGRRTGGRARWVSMAPGAGGTVWLAHMTRYSLEQRAEDGRVLRELVREAPWFRPHGGGETRADGPPQPRIVDVRLDARGRLWVPVHVADERWQEGIGEVKGIYDRRVTGVTAPDRAYDTIVEVIDPQRARLVASARFDPRLRLLGETGYAFSYREDEAGFPFVHIWRLRLEPEGGPTTSR